MPAATSRHAYMRMLSCPWSAVSPSLWLRGCGHSPAGARARASAPSSARCTCTCRMTTISAADAEASAAVTRGRCRRASTPTAQSTGAARRQHPYSSSSSSSRKGWPLSILGDVCTTLQHTGAVLLPRRKPRSRKGPFLLHLFLSGRGGPRSYPPVPTYSGELIPLLPSRLRVG